MFKSLKSLKELVFSKACISCSVPQFWLCPSCLAGWNTNLKKSSIDGKPIYFKSDYNSKTASVILAAKEGNDLNAIALRMRLDFSIGLQPRCLFTGRERVGGLTGTLFVNHPVSQFFPSGCCLRGLNDVVTILVMVAGQAGGLLSDRFRK